MKKRIFAFILSTAFICNNFAVINAEDNITDNTEITTEATTEEETEATTEEETETTTEKTTESTTKATEKTTENNTEATTNSTTTTTKKDTTNSGTTDVRETFSITIGEGEELNLEKELPTNVRSLSFDWNSSDSSIASVSSSGKLKGQDTGDCTVIGTATSGGTTYTYTFYIDVLDEVSKTREITIKVDDSKDLYDYVDDDFDEKDYTWESSNEKYVTVNSRGIITGEKKGSATVTAEYISSSKKYYYEFDVTVTYSDDDDDDDDDETASSVKTKTDWTIYVELDDEVDISDLLEDDPEDYDWDVKDDDIADIDEDTGEIEGLDEGNTKIYAEGDEDYTFTVKVSEDYSTESISLKGGATKDLENILDDDVDEYSFKSDRTSVAKVSSKGIVIGVAKGMATIVCEHDDGDIIQVFVNVTSNNSTTTTKETTTEATTKSAVTTTAKTSFNDISTRPWAIEAINAMAEKGFIVGVGQNKFSPDANCKRADFAIVLTKILGIDKNIAITNYADIKMGSYYYNYVGIAKDKGIECGIINGSYRPEAYITREEIMVMVYKGLVSQGKTFNTDTTVLNKYTDANLIAQENKTAVAALINSGAVTGTSDTILDAKSNITRAQMAVLMDKVYNAVNNK